MRKTCGNRFPTAFIAWLFSNVHSVSDKPFPDAAIPCYPPFHARCSVLWKSIRFKGVLWLFDYRKNVPTATCRKSSSSECTKNSFHAGMLTSFAGMVKAPLCLDGLIFRVLFLLVFRTFDTDNSGTVDFKEFLLAINVTSNGSATQKLEYAFRM